MLIKLFYKDKEHTASSIFNAIQLIAMKEFLIIKTDHHQFSFPYCITLRIEIDGTSISPVTQAALVKYMSPVGPSPIHPAKITKFLKHKEYLYELRYADYSEEAAMEFYSQYKKPTGLMGSNNKSIGPGFGCTSVHIGLFRGRNLDWYYDRGAATIIKVEAAEGRYASIGVINAKEFMTEDFMNTHYENQDTDDNEFNLAPYGTTDGMNEKGLIVNINIVPANDLDPITGTNPGKPDLCGLMIPRYLLDNAANVEEAITCLNNRNVYMLHNKGKEEELHCMISDSTGKCVIVEFIGNEMVVLDEHNNPQDYDLRIMTNFFLSKPFSYANNGKSHPQGIERYRFARDYTQEIGSEDVNGEVMFDIMWNLRYSQAYSAQISDEGDFTWYSEFYGVYDKYIPESLQGDYNHEEAFNETTPEEYFKDLLPIIRNVAEEVMANPRPDVSDNNVIWETSHMVIYDGNTLSAFIAVKEDYDNVISFSFNDN